MSNVSHRNASGVVFTPVTPFSTWYADENGNVTSLPPDTDGQVLTTHGPSAPPTWEPASSYPTVQNEGVDVTGSPHDTLNFVGDGVTVTDGGSGVATVTVAGNTVDTLQQTYDAGAATITESAAKPIAVTNTQTDGSHVLTLNKSPGSSSAGHALSATMGPNATGYGAHVAHSAIGANIVTRGGVLVENTTAAINGAQQWSAPVVLHGRGWHTTSGAASQATGFGLQVEPVQSGPYPEAKLHFWADVGEVGVDTPYTVLELDSQTNAARVLETFGFLGVDGTVEADEELTLRGDTLIQFDVDGVTAEWNPGGEFVPGVGGTSVGSASARWPYLYGERLNLVQPAAVTPAFTPDEMVFVQGGAHTALDNAEATDVFIDLARTVKFDGINNGGDPESGSVVIPLQRAMRITAPTYGNPTAGATYSYKITKAVTLAISGAPVDGGAQVAITNPYAFEVETGKSLFGGQVLVPTGTFGSVPALACSSDTDTGLGFDVATDQMAIMTGGSERVYFGSYGISIATGGALEVPQGTATACAVAFTGESGDTGIFGDSGTGDVLGISINGTERWRWNTTLAVSTVPIDLTGITSNTIGDIKFRNRTADPSTPTEGYLWYRSDLNAFYFYDGSSAVELGGGGGMTMTDITDSATISTTEYFLYADGTAASYQTDAVQLQVFLRFASIAAGDEFQVTVYEKIDGTAVVVLRDFVIGAQGEGWTSPIMFLSEGYEVSVDKLAGSDRVVHWTLREVT